MRSFSNIILIIVPLKPLNTKKTTPNGVVFDLQKECKGGFGGEDEIRNVVNITKMLCKISSKMPIP